MRAFLSVLGDHGEPPRGRVLERPGVAGEVGDRDAVEGVPDLGVDEEEAALDEAALEDRAGRALTTIFVGGDTLGQAERPLERLGDPPDRELLGREGELVAALR